MKKTNENPKITKEEMKSLINLGICLFVALDLYHVSTRMRDINPLESKRIFNSSKRSYQLALDFSSKTPHMSLSLELKLKELGKLLEEYDEKVYSQLS